MTPQSALLKFSLTPGAKDLEEQIRQLMAAVGPVYKMLVVRVDVDAKAVERKS